MLHINILSWSRWLTSRHCRLQKQISIKFNSLSCIVHFKVMWVIHILHRWDCRASFTTLKQSYSKHMQKKRERTHDARQNRMLNSPRQHDGKGSMRLMLMRIPFKDHCSAHTHTHTHRDAHIPLGWSKDRKCESCQPIGDWVIEEFDSERNILLPWWWTRRNDNWVH